MSFYAKLFADPYMFTLFDMTDPDTNVSSDQHGQRLGLFFLSFFGDDQQYFEVRGVTDSTQQLVDAHQRSKKCPRRGAMQGKQFTYNQMYSWICYLQKSATEFVKEDQVKTLMHIAANKMQYYAPFCHD